MHKQLNVIRMVGRIFLRFSSPGMRIRNVRGVRDDILCVGKQVKPSVQAGEQVAQGSKGKYKVPEMLPCCWG